MLKEGLSLSANILKGILSLVKMTPIKRVTDSGISQDRAVMANKIAARVKIIFILGSMRVSRFFLRANESEKISMVMMENDPSFRKTVFANKNRP